MIIEDDLKAALERAARAAGTSNAALIREFLLDRLEPLPPPEANPIWQTAGVNDYPPETSDDAVDR